MLSGIGRVVQVGRRAFECAQRNDAAFAECFFVQILHACLELLVVLVADGRIFFECGGEQRRYGLLAIDGVRLVRARRCVAGERPIEAGRRVGRRRRWRRSRRAKRAINAAGRCVGEAIQAVAVVLLVVGWQWWRRRWYTVGWIIVRWVVVVAVVIEADMIAMPILGLPDGAQFVARLLQLLLHFDDLRASVYLLGHAVDHARVDLEDVLLFHVERLLGGQHQVIGGLDDRIAGRLQATPRIGVGVRPDAARNQELSR